MKKITAFIGSPRKQGNTSILVDRILHSANMDNNMQVEKVFLNDLKITPCQGCMKCKFNGNTCVIQDDMTELYQKIQQTDAIIIAAPVYMGYVPAQMKLFMDRWYCFASFPPFEFHVKHGKKVLVVLCYANPMPHAYDFLGIRLQYFLTRYCNIEDVGTIIVHGVTFPGDVMRKDNKEEIFELTEKAGQLLADDRQIIKWHRELPGSLKSGPLHEKRRHSGRINDYDTLVFNKMTTYYEEKFELLFPLIDSHIKEKKEVTITDFGCGPGKLIVDFEKRYDVSQLYGIDLSRKMIDHAVLEVTKAGIEDKVKLFIADLESSDWQTPMGSIDIAFASQLINGLKSPVDFLGNVKTLLKPKGKVLIFDWIRFSLQEALEIWGRELGEKTALLYWRKFSKFTTDDFVKIMELAGFQVLETKQVPWYGGGIPPHSGKKIYLFVAAEPL
jgi:multimeric flavodoxin WrbA/SAM-dependent methyltransferase